MLAVIFAAALSAPNIVLISVDTLRSDHLGFYGHPHPTSPNLDALSENALVFDDMICEVPLTGPSFTSMLTSRFPRSTGVTRNGLRLPGGVSTIAQRFRDSGYETVCVTSNWTLKADISGLDRGFDVYDDAFKNRRWVFFKSERDAKDVTRLALHYLGKRNESKPLFAWFHYSDPHAPYEMRNKFRVSTEADYAGDPGAAEKVRYDSEIAYTDAQIRRLLDALPKENTFIVFIADHGESLHEHGYVGHGRRIYQTGLHIPFFVHGPGIDPGRTAVAARGVDVAPTLLGLAGIEPGPNTVGINLLREPPDDIPPRVVETYGGAVINLPGAKEIMANAGPDLQAVLYNGWKFIAEGDGDDPELYYLPDDPQELDNLANTHGDRAADLAGMIRTWASAVEKGTPEGTALTEEDIEAMRSLGYVE